MRAIILIRDYARHFNIYKEIPRQQEIVSTQKKIHVMYKRKEMRYQLA